MKHLTHETVFPYSLYTPTKNVYKVWHNLFTRNACQSDKVASDELPLIWHYLLTPWSRVLLEKLTGSAASQEIPRIFGTRRFITIPTSARHLSLS